MKYHKVIYAFLPTIFLQGCASPMPDGHYSNLGRLYAGVEYCYKNDEMDVYSASDTQDAIRYVLSTWKYDNTRFNNTVNQYNQMQFDCKDIKLTAYQITSRVSERKESNIENTKQLNSNLNDNRIKNTFCNKIGTQTICSTY